MKDLKNNIDKNKFYSFKIAIEKIKNIKKKPFKESIDASIQLEVNPKKKYITIKGHSFLPHNIEKKFNTAVFITKNEKNEIDNEKYIVLNEDNINDINKKNIKFNLIITTPKSIMKIGKLNKILNSKKIIPDIKYGTITTNPSETLNKLKKNYIKFKNDKNNIIHVTIGKIDLETNKLKENIETIINDIKKSKPENCKNISIKKINISSTMSPGLKININSLTF